VSWSETFLGIIAVTTVIMAAIQVSAIVTAAKLMRQAQQALNTVQQDIRPLIAKAHTIADEAARTAALTTAQAEKVDRLVTDLSVRIDQTAALVQEAIVMPAREGMAIVAALKAGLSALRGYRDRPRAGRTADEEDPLFIG
jgi:hypothetical protein